MMGWQWHQPDNMQMIGTLFQTDNQASTSPISFYRPDALPAAQPTASKHRKHIITRMWADAQRDGRPAEYSWRPLFNATKFG